MRRESVQLFGKPYVERKPRKRSPADVPTEAAEQRLVCEWLNARRLLYTHPANEGRRSPITGAHLRGLGMKRGVPDLLIFTPPIGKFGIVGVALEMKRRAGSTITTEQREWIDALRSHGWRAEVCFGADDAIAVLEGLYDP